MNARETVIERGTLCRAPRCPKCRWFLAFAPYGLVYTGNDLNLWEGYCRNPACKYQKHSSISGARPVGPHEATR